MFEPAIAPSGTLLGLLQRGRGDGTLHALAAPRAEALQALYGCVIDDPRHDWQVENRSLYYARLCLELDAPVDALADHLFAPDDVLRPDEQRTGLTLSVLGHLASYGRDDALKLLRRYAAAGGCWQWALDELALRDDDAGLRALAPHVLARFPRTPDGERELAAEMRGAFEPRPWRLWAEDPELGARVRAAQEQESFDRWQRQLRSRGPRPGWSVAEILDWAQDGLEQYPAQPRHDAAARCLAAVAGPEDRPELLVAARGPRDGARAAAVAHLAATGDPEAYDLIEAAACAPSETLAGAALATFGRMCSTAALGTARSWAAREDALGTAAGVMLARRGAARDARAVRTVLLRCVRDEGPGAPELCDLVAGAGRLAITSAAPVLRHIYRETGSSHLRGVTARALAATDPSFPASFAVECLWDCEDTTREIGARHAETADARVVARLRSLAADPAEDGDVQSTVRTRITPDGASG
ncbi:HEAT repeat domain-containing protein [Streptomyces aculeolatus]